MSDYELGQGGELSAEEERALAAVLAEPELSADEWEALHARVAAAGELPLARRRRATQPRRRAAMRWLLPALPLAAAAALLILVRSGTLEPRPGSSAQTADLTAVERVLLADVSDAEFARMVSGADDAEALLLLAADQ